MELEFLLEDVKVITHTITITPPTEEDDKRCSSKMLNTVNEWDEKLSKLMVNYIVSNGKPSAKPILNTNIVILKPLIKKYVKYVKGKGLTKKDIVKLHHYSGHCTVERLEN